jgi:hypothetical protein
MMLTHTSAYRVVHFGNSPTLYNDTSKEWHPTSDGSPIICTISYIFLEHCILSAGRLHLANLLFAFANPHLYYRSHDFATGRYPDTRRLLWRQPNHTHPPTSHCKYPFSFLCLSFITLVFSLAHCNMQLYYLLCAISNNHYCLLAASKEGRKDFLFDVATRLAVCPWHQTRVDVDACGRNFIMKEN